MGRRNTPPITKTKIIQSIIFTNYSHKGVAFFVGFVRIMQYPSMIIWICYGAKGFIIYLNKGIAYALSNFRHKQYPSNSLDQNNPIHVFI